MTLARLRDRLLAAGGSTPASEAAAARPLSPAMPSTYQGESSAGARTACRESACASASSSPRCRGRGRGSLHSFGTGLREEVSDERSAQVASRLHASRQTLLTAAAIVCPRGWFEHTQNDVRHVTYTTGGRTAATLAWLICVSSYCGDAAPCLLLGPQLAADDERKASCTLTKVRQHAGKETVNVVHPASAASRVHVSGGAATDCRQSGPRTGRCSTYRRAKYGVNAVLRVTLASTRRRLPAAARPRAVARSPA